METPSEWAKRFNREKAGEETAGSPHPEVAIVDSSSPVVEFPTEAFQCPACGQLLGPSCRVCVSCKHVINPADIVHQPEPAAIAPSGPVGKAGPAPVRFPWLIFFAVLELSFFLGLMIAPFILLGFLKQEHAEMALQGVSAFAGVWVFADALRRRIPRPLRWALGTTFLFIIIFPWYLARRSMPQSPVPFVESKIGPVTRFLLVDLIIFFVLNKIHILMVGPSKEQPKSQVGNERKAEGRKQ